MQWCAQEDGGALHLGYVAVTVAVDGAGSGLVGNTAGRSGGAVFVRSAISSVVVSDQARMQDNSAGGDGECLFTAYSRRIGLAHVLRQ